MYIGPAIQSRSLGASIQIDRSYRPLLDGTDPNGVPLRQVLELLQREQIRSPDH
jgi:hypothetical protein